VLVDLESSRWKVSEVIAELRKNSTTRHLPVIAYAREEETGWQQAARAAGATLVVSEAGLLSQLPQLLDQALQVE